MLRKIYNQVTLGMLLCMTLPMLSGCAVISFHKRKPIRIKVVDAETDEPIENAKIDIEYLRGRLLVSMYPYCPITPEAEMGFTDRRGECKIPIADHLNVTWTVSAKGYHERSLWTKIWVPDRIPSEVVPLQSPFDAIVRLYRDPGPTYEVVIPQGYRGPLLIKEVPNQKLGTGAIETGKRQFSFHPNRKGYVEVEQIPYVSRLHNDIKFRYDDGSEVSTDEKSDDAIVLRFVASDIYVLGTKSDYDAMHRKVHHYINGDPKHITNNQEAIRALFENAKSNVD